jgi:glycosyltransferase involved in cell wall biosynthesis
MCIKMKERRFVVWMNQPSYHQTSFFRELASRPGVVLSVVYAGDVAPERRALGWETAQAEIYEQGYLNSAGWLGRLFSTVWRERKSTHLINGVWSVPKFVIAAFLLSGLRADFFFHSEGPIPGRERQGFFRWVKRIVGRILLGWSKGIFAIGDSADNYYRALGVPAWKIFRFTYFISGLPRLERTPAEDKTLRITYLGQFAERKRPADAIGAVSLLAAEGIDFRLRFVGSGPLREKLESLAQKKGLVARVSIEGPIKPSQIVGVLAATDVLILPSSFDGWGLTVNEALHAGVPVVVSDRCNSSEVMIKKEWGAIYPTGDELCLAAALRSAKGGEFRVNQTEVAGLIGCQPMTDYFVACVEWDRRSAAEKPRPAWLDHRSAGCPTQSNFHGQ